MNRINAVVCMLLIVLLAGCIGSGSATSEMPVAPAATTPAAAPTSTTPATVPAPTLEPSPTAAAAPSRPPTSFEAATHRDESAGFEFDYPSAWTLSDQALGGDRGSVVQFISDGQPRLDVTVLRWDPKNDLAAFVNARKLAWDASGFSIVSEEEFTLAGDRRTVRFVIQTQTGEQAFFFFTTVGERYLELSGSGDLELLAEVSRTVRPLGTDSQVSTPEALDCSRASADRADWVACNVIDGIRSRNLSALHGYMANPFAIGYWGSEGRSASREEITAELAEQRLPPDPSSPMTFTIDQSQFPPLGGQPPRELFGPDANIVTVIYSEGWGQDGAGAAMLFIARNQSGAYYWHGMIYSDGHFDKP